MAGGLRKTRRLVRNYRERTIANQRGAPGIVISTMMAAAPGGASTLLDDERDSPVVESAAAVREM